MDWMGIGVLLIGIALLIVAIILIKPLNKLSDVLDNVQKTTSQLPEMVDDISLQTTEILDTSYTTLDQVNRQVSSINPFFQIVGDVGKASRSLTLTALKKTDLLKDSTSQAVEFTKREKYEGAYGFLAFLFFLQQHKNEMKDAVPMKETNKHS